MSLARHRCDRPDRPTSEPLTDSTCEDCGQRLCVGCEDNSEKVKREDPGLPGARMLCIDCYEVAAGLTAGEEVNDDAES
jgi:hypothetical protein